MLGNSWQSFVTHLESVPMHDEESITEYSHELAALVDHLESAIPRHGNNRDSMLRDQLVENVREPILRW